MKYIILMLILHFPLFAVGKTFYIDTDYGPMSITVKNDLGFDEAIKYENGKITLSSETTLQLVVTNESEHFTSSLLELLINIIFFNQGNNTNGIYEYGENMVTSHYIELARDQDNTVLSEVHCLGTLNLDTTPSSSSNKIDPETSNCLFGCGRKISRNTLYQHHSNSHAHELKEIKLLCNNSFSCKFCNKMIFSLTGFTKHIFGMHRDKLYYDFF